jgi:hypothetical protein
MKISNMLIVVQAVMTTFGFLHEDQAVRVVAMFAAFLTMLTFAVVRTIENEH